jgi:hypothetical protein
MLRPTGTAQLTPGSTGSHGWANMPAAGPPPMVPLPPIPNSQDSAVDLKGKRRSVNLASPVRSTFSYSAADSTAASTPTTAAFHTGPPPSAFHRSNPSGATFGVARSVSARSGDHSRASSLGSATEASFRPSVPALPGAFAGYKIAAGNASTSTFGGIGDGRNGSSSSLGEEPTPFKSKARMSSGHKPTFSTSTAHSDETAYGNDKRFTTMSTDGFAGGLAALSASINSSTPSSGTDSSPSRITDATRSTSSSAANIASQRTFPTVAIEDEEPFDIQAELEKIKKDRERREKMDRRASSSSMMSNFSTRTNNTFRGAGSRVMDVSPEEVQNDDAAEMAGERLLDSLGDDLEGLGVWNGGKKSHVSRSLAPGKRTGSSSRPGSSKGPGPSGLSSAANSRPTSMIGSSKKIAFPQLSPDPSPRGSAPDLVIEAEDADETITLPKTGIHGASSLSKAQTSSAARESIFSLYTHRDSIHMSDDGIAESGSNFGNRLSAEVESRASSGSSISQQISMKEPTRRFGSNGKIPDLRVEEAGNLDGGAQMASSPDPSVSKH